ncbi:MAG: pyridoxal-phosphate dependent enzyme [Candidatus Eremiobacteraeota bacterium]|nr:pyridoxal-phosphate dependent enzyme [Candidatus Eremiobacteraeota bacterium]
MEHSYAVSAVGESDAVVASVTQIVSFTDVRDASKRLRGVAHRTPVLTSRQLDARAAAQVFLKCENLQRTGSFKIRGAYNRLAQLSEAEQERGVVAFSSGNHAAAVALAAQLLGLKATIVVPSDAPQNKIEATRGYGAELVFYDWKTGHREAIAEELAQRSGGALVPSYDDPRIIAGQGTAALELLEEVDHLDAIVVATSGGGLLSGTAVAAHGIDDRIQLYGVEPETADDFARSLAAGARITGPVPDTIADALRTQSPGEITFELALRHGCKIVTVSDDQLKSAMRFAFDRLKLVLEPGGAAGLAAVREQKIGRSHERVGVILSGGNIDVARFTTLLSR